MQTFIIYIQFGTSIQTKKQLIWSLNELHHLIDIKMNSKLNHNKREQHYLIGCIGKECTEGRTSWSDRNTAAKNHCSERTATSFLTRSAVLQHSFHSFSCMQIHASAQTHLLRFAAVQPHKQTNPNIKVRPSAASAFTALHFHLESTPLPISRGRLQVVQSSLQTICP